MKFGTNQSFRTLLFGAIAMGGANVVAHTGSIPGTKTETILVGSSYAELLGLEVLLGNHEANVAVAKASPKQLEKLSNLMHAKNRCGGFELLPSSTDHAQAEVILGSMLTQIEKTRLEEAKLKEFKSSSAMQVRPEIVQAFEHVSPEAQRQWVDKMSSFNTRYHNSSTRNTHVEWMVETLQNMAKQSSLEIVIDRISHNRTNQDSVRARIVGKTRPNEIVGLGGHFDSTVGWFSNDRRSPGADDNASGSANILEAFRIMSQMAQPERTIEFFWYAAEEIGLVGSAEIAQTYKREGKDVVAVLQLDMTLEPGSGPMVIASMEDFTSPWLRELLVDANRTYDLGLSIIADECGYGCSDHASWFRQGYSTLMPFESSFREMNRDIHTESDTITNAANFEHSSTFTKIALIFAGELANSDRRAP